MRGQQAVHDGVSAAAHVVRGGDHGGGATNVDLSEEG
jgi:type IV secretion system protein TrbL